MDKYNQDILLASYNDGNKLKFYIYKLGLIKMCMDRYPCKYLYPPQLIDKQVRKYFDIKRKNNEIMLLT